MARWLWPWPVAAVNLCCPKQPRHHASVQIRSRALWPSTCRCQLKYRSAAIPGSPLKFAIRPPRMRKSRRAPAFRPFRIMVLGIRRLDCGAFERPPGLGMQLAVQFPQHRARFTFTSAPVSWTEGAAAFEQRPHFWENGGRCRRDPGLHYSFDRCVFCRHQSFGRQERR